MKIGSYDVPILLTMLIFIPITFVLQFMHASGTWIFIASGLAIIPLAGILGEATEHIAEHVGPGIGGLLNATFGNAAELIIAIFALQAGLYEIVKASITGSIIGNLLLVLGLSMVATGEFRLALMKNHFVGHGELPLSGLADAQTASTYRLCAKSFNGLPSLEMPRVIYPETTGEFGSLREMRAIRGAGCRYR